MTEVFQFIGDDDAGRPLVQNGFFTQPAPRSCKPILLTILNGFGDPVGGNLTALVNSLKSTMAIKMPSFIIPTEAQAQPIVGQMVGYLLQWAMTNWTSGAFTSLAMGGNMISFLEDSGDA